ncbi:lipase family alpha/beta hydrolase [Pseudobdellovibrio exovorus]|uniref:DUF676 domain-containing protein n=1 Tax=Pseudobdellovibrio exovorus JSS TaxID=1184267 RepID=M4VCW5_9BACT|nr:hypothetical protein [Pseudobdellovibrio exovorus]AGH95881.1 hypothetical protein A11Q_1665 [Pseudobdellovibrio exovorus JSS]
MKSFFLKFVFILGFLCTALAAKAQDVVVLVPGFFNSLAPEYFSNEIISSFKNKGFKVYIPTGFNPVGTIEDNGSRLEKFLAQVEKAENKRVSFNLVSHSAGGFYSLYVANRQQFTIKNIVTISTPFQGVDFVTKWLEDSTLFRALTELAHLDSLKQLTPQGVKAFISSVRIQPETKILAFGGFQKKSLDIWNARYISAPMRISSHFTNGDSDGIVSYSSSMGLGHIMTTQGKSAVQLRHPNYPLSLDHWEQVLDSHAFLLLGIRNPSYIQKEQKRFYTGIADYLLKQQ